MQPNIIKYHFFGVHQNPELNTNKFWGWMEVNGKFYNFWGRLPSDSVQDKKIKFKIHESFQAGYQLENLVSSKKAKGYIPVNHNDLNAIHVFYPDFNKKMQEQLFLAVLSDDILGLKRAQE
jgi:predicted DNA-binding WGR domain protein